MPAVLVGIVVAALGMWATGKPLPTTFSPPFIVFCIGALLLYFIGVVDDLFSVGARLKFLVQFLVSASFPTCGLYIDNLYGFFSITVLPLWASWLLTVVVLLLIINAVNLIDGIDGLASALTLVVLAIFGSHLFMLGNLLLPVFCCCLAGTIAVFIYFNMCGSVERKTKTFMGDSGSLFLGVVLGYLTILYTQQNSLVLPPHTDGLLIAYSSLLVPCFDLCRVALSRLYRHQGIFVADRTHIHHLLMDAGFSMHSSLVVIIVMQIGFFALNLFLAFLDVALECIVLVDVLVFAFFNLGVARMREYKN